MISPPESKTERLVVMVSPTEKRDITQRARSHGMDTSEFVRSRCGANDPADDKAEAELVELACALDGLATDAKASLEEGLSALNATIAALRRS